MRWSLWLFGGLLWVAPVYGEDLTQLQQVLSQRRCQGCNLQEANLSRADLRGVSLKKANLQRANLSSSNLRGAQLQGADLSQASLNGADLSGADLTGALLEGVDLRSANLSGAILQPQQLDRAYLQNARGLTTNQGRFEQFHNWGVSAAQAGQHERAIQFYGQALERNPDSGITYLARAIARQNLNDNPGALEDAQQAAEKFTVEGNTSGADAAKQFGEALEASLNPKKPNGFMQGLSGIAQTIVPLALQFLAR
jgi:tetratricopeptide (TPR) repeat protein